MRYSTTMSAIERVGSPRSVYTTYYNIEVARQQTPSPRIAQKHPNKYFRDETQLIQDIQSRLTYSPVEVWLTGIILGRSHASDDLITRIFEQGIFLTTYNGNGQLNTRSIPTGIFVDIRM